MCVTVKTQLATARETFHVDVNVGDPIRPAPQAVLMPRLLGGEIALRGYPVAMMLEVARHRRTPLTPLRTTLAGYPELAQERRRRWRDRQHLQDRLPAPFAEVLEAIVAFADPLLSAAAPAGEAATHTG